MEGVKELTAGDKLMFSPFIPHGQGLSPIRRADKQKTEACLPGVVDLRVAVITCSGSHTLHRVC